MNGERKTERRVDIQSVERQSVEELERVHRGSPNQVTTRVEVTCGGLWEFLRSTKLLGHKGLQVQSDPLVLEGVFLRFFV